MPSQGPNSCVTGADDNSYGTDIWLLPGNITVSDDSRSTVAITTGTHYLNAQDFGFTIPTGATINGIVVEWEKSAASSGRGFAAVKDDRIRIIKAGSVGATDKSDNTAWSTTDTYVSYGSSTDLWGETWTVSNINGTDFGAVLAAKLSGAGTNTARVDHVRITVYYTAASSGNFFLAFSKMLFPEMFKKRQIRLACI